MKLILIISVILCLTSSIHAQKYFKDFYTIEDEETTEDSAYYYKEGKFLFGRYFGEIKEIYVSNNQLKSKSFHDSLGVLNGKSLEYFENGNLKREVLFKNGQKIGPDKHYYSNSKPKEIRLYDTSKSEYNFEIETGFQIMSYWDSLGNQLVVDGNGTYFHSIFPDSESYTFGSVENGNKTGNWKGFYGNGNLYFTESYMHGKLVEGQSIAKDSALHSYTKLSSQPEPKKGMAYFYRYVAKNVKYPKIARRHGVEGRVFVGFVVDKSGKLIDANVLKGISVECDAEAVRVITEASDWTVGLMRGIPVKVRMVLPITFKLS